MTLSDFGSRLGKVKPTTKKGGPGLIGRCPSCEAKGFDKTGDHLLVVEGADGWLHVKCIRGCSEEEILGAMSLTQEDRRVAPPERGRPAAPKEEEYPYVDAGGTLLFKKIRS